MKKILFIILLCFTVAFAAFAIDMSPHPGDPVETVFTVLDNVVINQAVTVPAENMLYLEQFNYTNEICLSTNEEMIESPYYLMGSDYNVDMAVFYIGYEMGNDIFMQTVGVVAIYKTEFG